MGLNVICINEIFSQILLANYLMMKETNKQALNFEALCTTDVNYF